PRPGRATRATHSSWPCPRMQHRQLPPARASPSQCEISKPWGADQWRRCSGSIQAWKTRLRGASKTRMMTSSSLLERVRDSLLRSAAMPIVLLLVMPGPVRPGLERFQVLVEAVQPLFPVTAVPLPPLPHLLLRRPPDPAGTPPGFPPPCHQLRAPPPPEGARSRPGADGV